MKKWSIKTRLPARQLLGAALGATLGMGLLSPVATAQTRSGQYVDVPADHWAQQALQKLAQQHGLSFGYPDGTFKGDRTLTRYEMAAVLLKLIEQRPKARTAPDTAALQALLKTELEALSNADSAEREEILDRLDLLETQQMEQAESLIAQFQRQLPFRLSGSIALRHEHLTDDITGTPTSSTPQSRVILSLDSIGDSPFGYGTRLSVGNLRNSTNPWWRLGDFNARVEFALDRFFIRWRPTDFFEMTAGKFANVYSNSELFMDMDVQPEGAFQRFHFENIAPGWRHASLTLGETIFSMNQALGDNSFMLSAKGDTGFDLGFATLDMSGAYHQYFGETVLFEANEVARERGIGLRTVGNAMRNTPGTRFGIANGNAALRWRLFDVPMALSGDYLYNVLAPAKNQAAQGRFSIGQARNVGEGQLSYVFKYLEQDASVSLFVEDQLMGTDVMAHEVQASLKVWDQTTLFGTYQWSQRLSEADANPLHTLRVGVFQAF